MTLKISSRSQLPPFMVMDVMERAEALEIGDNHVIHLEIGQPSTPAPQPSRDAIIRDINTPASHGYTRTRGKTELTKAIARHYKRWYGHDIHPEQVVCTTGSSFGFMMVFLACFEVGDVIAMTTPGYSAYRNLMQGASLKPMLLDVRAKENWRLTTDVLDRLDTIPDGLIIANPANPTGIVMTREELVSIVKWCEKNGVRLISDEIYHGISFGTEDHSVLEFSSSAMVMNSYSKYFSMTGHRLGWIIAPEDLIEPFDRIAQNSIISPPTLSQIAGIAAMDDPASYKEMESHVKRYHENRDILMDSLPKRFLGNFPVPEGGFYIYADTSGISDNSIELADRILNELLVATTPGVDFDDEHGNLFLRLSFAGKTADMTEAARRISDWLGH